MTTPHPTPRLDLGRDAAGPYAEMQRLERSLQVDPALKELLKIRASQINGCAFCLDMHATDAVKAGEEHRRLHALAAWRDTPWFDDGERAALALTEAVTRIGDGRAVDDAIVADVVEQFGEETYAKLLLAIVVINGWNRLNVTSHLSPPG